MQVSFTVIEGSDVREFGKGNRFKEADRLIECLSHQNKNNRGNSWRNNNHVM